MSDSDSKFKYLGEYSVTEQAMFEMALDFIDSEVIGSIEITAGASGLGGYGLTGIKVTREQPWEDTVTVEPEVEEFSPEFVRDQMNLCTGSAKIRLFKKGVALEDVSDVSEG